MVLATAVAVAAVGGVVAVMAFGDDEAGAGCAKSPPPVEDADGGFHRFGSVAVIGFDPETGEQRWVQTLGDLYAEAGGSGPAGSAAIRDGVGVFFSNPDGPAFQIDLSSGEILSCREGRTDQDPADLLPGGDGEPVVTPSYTVGEFEAEAEGVRIVLQQFTPALSAIDTEDGRTLWETPLGSSLPVVDRVFIVGDRAIAAGLTSVAAVDLDTGRLLWTADHGSPASSEPYTANGSYWYFIQDPDNGTIVGANVAESPVPEGY